MNKDSITVEHYKKQYLFDAERWGAPKVAIADLAKIIVVNLLDQVCIFTLFKQIILLQQEDDYAKIMYL